MSLIVPVWEGSLFSILSSALAVSFTTHWLEALEQAEWILLM
jgi:hypothetical protein